MSDPFFLVLLVLLIVLLVFFWKQQQAVRVLRQSLDEAQKNPAMTMLQQELIAMRAQMQQESNAMRGQIQDSLHKVTQQVDERLKESVKIAQESQHSVGQRLDQNTKGFGELQNRLGQIEQANKQILVEFKEMESLKDILKPPKLRGGMGETLLENMIRQIFPSEEYYSFQHRFKDGEIVDAVIRLKSGLVPVDAKFPLENFQRMIDAASEQEKRDARREFTRNVKKHIDDISKKYIRADEGTLNFALMYVPAENIYYEIIAREDGEDSLLPYTFQKRVFPVSPHTFYAFLFTLAQWVGVMQFEEKTKLVWDHLTRFRKDFDSFTDHFNQLGTHLTHARGKYEDVSKKRDRLDAKLSSIQEGKVSEIAASEEILKLETPP